MTDFIKGNRIQKYISRSKTKESAALTLSTWIIQGNKRGINPGLGLQSVNSQRYFTFLFGILGSLID